MKKIAYCIIFLLSLPRLRQPNMIKVHLHGIEEVGVKTLVAAMQVVEVVAAQQFQRSSIVKKRTRVMELIATDYLQNLQYN